MDIIDIGKLTCSALSRQHLTGGALGRSVIQIVRDIAGLHATGVTVPYVSLLARSARFQKRDLECELYEHRTLGRVRCVRKALYIHTTSMLPIALKATQSTTLSVARAYMHARGVSAAQYTRLSKAILELLDGREMTAAAIKSALKTKADVSSILWLMCDEGLLIRGRPSRGWRDPSHAYALFRDYFPDMDLDALSEREAIQRLVHAYLAAFGPAAEADVAWWTGLTKAKVRSALQDLSGEMATISVSGVSGTFLLLRQDLASLTEVEAPEKPSVNLLPRLDPYLMGYWERRRYMDDEFRPFLFDRGGNATSTILVNGHAAGVWDFADEPEPTVKLFIFRGAPKRIRDEIERQADQVGRFLADGPVRLQHCQAMIPLRQSTAGGFMSPLRGS